MKIGIVTFWWSQDNYGQLLQCYALQKFLIDNGHDVFLIKYNSCSDYEKTPFYRKVAKAFNPVKVVNHLLYKSRQRELKSEQLKNPRYFEDFRNKYLKSSDFIYHSFEELKMNPPEADAYIVGSDQVWNYNLYSKNALNAYFLNFGNESTKRISYAASWGIKSIDIAKKSQIAELLRKFDYVGVREKNGIKLCEDCGYKSAEWVPDPTMLLHADVYRSIYREVEFRKIDKPFLLLYMLGNKNDFDIQKAYDFADKKGLEVVYVSGNEILDKREKYYATIPEWLYLIDNADYIITNSFHCCVISTILNKKYGAIKLTGEWAGANDRLESLFERFGIEYRYINNDDLLCMENEYISSSEIPCGHILEVLK